MEAIVTSLKMTVRFVGQHVQPTAGVDVSTLPGQARQSYADAAASIGNFVSDTGAPAHH